MPISIKEIKSLINNLLKEKALVPDRFTGGFNQIYANSLQCLSENRKKGNVFLTHSMRPALP